jgi:hypothetical protein
VLKEARGFQRIVGVNGGFRVFHRIMGVNGG